VDGFGVLRLDATPLCKVVGLAVRTGGPYPGTLHDGLLATIVKLCV
jgi:hypothetical protein